MTYQSPLMNFAGMFAETLAPERFLSCLKAVADEKRLAIITLLAAGEKCVCELQEALDAGQSLLSFHLRTLRDAGLVSDRREGRWVYYTLDAEAFEDLEAFLRDVRRTPPEQGPVSRCAE